MIGSVSCGRGFSPDASSGRASGLKPLPHASRCSTRLPSLATPSPSRRFALYPAGQDGQGNRNHECDGKGVGIGRQGKADGCRRNQGHENRMDHPVLPCIGQSPAQAMAACRKPVSLFLDMTAPESSRPDVDPAGTNCQARIRAEACMCSSEAPERIFELSPQLTQPFAVFPKNYDTEKLNQHCY